MRLERKDVAPYIENFLAGTGERWDWDDFSSFQIDSPELEAVRLQCVQLPDNYPPETLGTYCNAEGLRILETVLKSLRCTNSE
jgi:hypothetical protein